MSYRSIKQYTQKGEIRGSGERNYTVKCVNYHLYIALIYF